MPRYRIPERRERLLGAARQLALEKGWPDTTVADIAERAGIGKGAVYLEFATKAAILDALINQGMRGLGAAVHQRVLAEEGLLDLPTLYKYAVEALLDDALMRAFYLGDHDVLGEHVRQVSDDRYRQRFDWLGEYLMQLQRAGVIAEDIDLPAATRMLSVFTIGLLHAPGALGNVTDDQLRSTVALFAEMVGQGLTADRPADADAVQRAQLSMLERLQAQLDHLPTDSGGEEL